MYFLGHMVWAYIFAMSAWAFIPAVKRCGKLFVPVILILGILPDSDLLLESFGIAHRTVTHSFLFWIVIFAPVFFVLRLKAVPYFVAVVQHFAFGDLLMGKTMIFWPFNSSFFGLNFGMPSTVDVVLEMTGLLIALGIMIYVGDIKRLLSVNKNNIYMILPLLALLTSAVFFIFHWQLVGALITFMLSSYSITILAIGHVILVVFLVVSTLQGLRARKPKKIPKTRF